MGCCGSGSHEPKQNNKLAVEKSNDAAKPRTNIFAWVVAIAFIIGLVIYFYK